LEDGTKVCGAWPGTQVTKDDEGWWSYTFDITIQKVNIIWNNGSGAQTKDITAVTASTCYSLEQVIDCDTPLQEGLDDIPASESSAPQKIMIDNVIYILRGSHTYTVDGQLVRYLRPGGEIRSERREKYALKRKIDALSAKKQHKIAAGASIFS
jgi:hypothetical protein